MLKSHRTKRRSAAKSHRTKRRSAANSYTSGIGGLLTWMSDHPDEAGFVEPIVGKPGLFFYTPPRAAGGPHRAK